MSTRPSRFSLPSSQATASAKARWISSPMMRVLPPSLFVQSVSWRATRHHGASGKVARGGHATSSGSQPGLWTACPDLRAPGAPVPDGLTITPSPFGERADSKAPTDLRPDNGQAERMNRTIKDATVKRYFYQTHDEPRVHLCDLLRPITSPEGSTPSEASHPTSASAKPGPHSRNDLQSVRSRKCRD